MQKHTKIKGFAKFRLIFILALMSSIAPLSTDMYLPALSQVKQSFETSEFLTQLSLASFFVAFALGQLIYGPLSDVFGRKIPALVGIFLFMLSSLFCVIIDNIYVFIILRFFEALGGCAGVVIARAIVNDLFELKEAASIFALMMVFSALAPMLSPSFGGFLIEYFSWHSIFATLFGLGILLFLLIFFALKESAPHLKRQKFSHKETLKSYRFVLKDKPFILYVSCASLVLAAMFAYITGSSFVFINFFGLSERDFGLLFGLNALGFVIFANINAKMVRKIDSEKILFYALIIMLISTLILFVNSLIKPNFWLFELSIFTSIALLGFIAPNTTTLAMARFKDHSGTASAVLGTSQFALAGVISFIVSAVGANTPVILALIMLICVVLANGVYFAMKK
ncbi:multidrug effflux MFS transporter [Campylobacter upsaliensis]|uniref:Bcr/CflA family drug resistance transporter n=1 Tax=Campylobacter upsaliensis JV21 TaxID=888826 RepID=A0A828QY61_CAMUP|nr:multidrug effflux MFS transporter [Campylobacter upsaliensis]EAH5546342.1 Bcr/CflA family efflux MFS transporter [Campylobacter upsaliensis]EAH5553380.1 Bcr/CflA family efflux MFS transporter [Campylobacter upsaliensis]EAH6025293.1 Bcr/CflA family efflux MFS transporter [Campylobacter upsaliensis]EAH6028889.1 Bcr/CflA family efflux MFS transporter [Campylobacter upsaliensis]EAH6228686.1 Bcr/CflA family efflux MFS transporter [Campylobacter upsaliensis]